MEFLFFEKATLIQVNPIIFLGYLRNTKFVDFNIYKIRIRMGHISMVDLKGQYYKIKDEIDSKMQEVIDTAAFIKGPQVRTFECHLSRYLNVNHVITCGNGTDALQIALMALGLKHGDEVITADFTFIATVEVVALLGLKPVLVDVDPETYTIDIEKLEKAITPRTKAIIPVHLFGQCADMEPILQLAHKHKLFVIEDTAQATGATYTFSDGTVMHAGTMGDIGTTSFFPSKNLGCFGDGGALFVKDDNIADRVRMVANHGMKVRYHHDMIGVNSRLDTLQAAVLDVKLKYLDQYNKARCAAADFYDNAFADVAGVSIPVRAENSTHIFHQYTLVLDAWVNRDDLMKFLDSKGIPSMVYYPIPLHRQEAMGIAKGNDRDFPVTEMLCSRVFSLPMHTELDADQQKYISDSVIEFLSQNK